MSKAARKRVRKIKQRLEGYRLAWTEPPGAGTSARFCSKIDIFVPRTLNDNLTIALESSAPPGPKPPGQVYLHISAQQSTDLYHGPLMTI